MPDDQPRVLVAVLTYLRPADLAAILPLLDAEAAASGADVDILVVDNDPAGGARDAVAAGPARARYAHEPRSGIAAARNRALDELGGAGYDVLVFVDDDERPRPGWLGQLLGTRTAHPAAPGVVGPVVSDFEAEPDAWVRAGGFFTRRRLPTGTAVTVAATNNLLLEADVLRRTGLRFADTLGLAGGSDTLFTRQLVAAAGPLVWCDEAVVTDVVPAARSTRGWVLRRQLRSGNSWSRTAIMLCGSGPARAALRARLTVLGGLRLAGGVARSALGLVTRDLGHRARGAKTTARGAGMLLGAWGWGYAEYARPSVAPATTVGVP